MDKHAIITLIAAFALAASGMLVGIIFGMRIAQPKYMPSYQVEVQYPNGQQVLTELQAYRRSLGLPEFQLSDILCDEIGTRWQNYRKTNSHEGWSEFIDRNYPPGLTATEILAPGNTAEEVVNNWKQSPSHDLAIKHNSKTCVYSSEGYSVAILSN